MVEATDKDDRLAALVPTFNSSEFATAHVEYTASKGMSRVTMWVSRERGNEFHAAAMKLRDERRDARGYDTEVIHDPATGITETHVGPSMRR